MKRFFYEMLVATLGLIALYTATGIIWVLYTSLVG